MLFGVPGNLENEPRTLTGYDSHTLDLLFSGPISRPEFAADFFKTFGTFRYFGFPFGTPFGTLWLENGGLNEGLKKGRKQVLRVIPRNLSGGVLAPEEEDLRPPSSSKACRI